MSCNYDSVYMATIIGIIMFFYICFLKLIVYGDIYYAYDSCYPPTFFFGFTESGRHFVYDTIWADKEKEQQDAFINETTQPIKNTDSIVVFAERLQSLGKQIFYQFPQDMQSISYSVWNKIAIFLKESMGISLSVSIPHA